MEKLKFLGLQYSGYLFPHSQFSKDGGMPNEKEIVTPVSSSLKPKNTKLNQVIQKRIKYLIT